MAPAAPAFTEPVFLTIEEKLSVTLSKDGGVESLEVQGSLALVVAAEADATLQIALTSGDNAGYQFKTHPNIDKATCVARPAPPLAAAAAVAGPGAKGAA
jgi:hypothetical protein